LDTSRIPKSLLVGPLAFLAAALALIILTPGLGVAVALPPGGTFVDDDGNIHEGNIEAIAATGVTKGCNPPANNRYCPTTSITRGQMAAFLARAKGLPRTATDYFDDDDGSIFENDINALAASGITKGCNPPDNDRFCPDRKLTRGQMAALLVRAFDYDDHSGGDRFVDDNGSKAISTSSVRLVSPPDAILQSTIGIAPLIRSHVARWRPS
jgi:S-layer homology domain